MPSNFGGTNFKQTTMKVKLCRLCHIGTRKLGSAMCFKCLSLKKRQRDLRLKEKRKEKRENNTRLLKKELDRVFSIFIRMSAADGLGMVTCPCCGARIPWDKAQCMHYNGRAKMNTRYNEDNCYAGCMRCNVMLNGNYPAFTDFLLNTNGSKWLQELIEKGRQIKQWQAWELRQLIEHYKEEIKKLSTV